MITIINEGWYDLALNLSNYSTKIVQRERERERVSMRQMLDRTKRLLGDMEKLKGRDIDTLAVALVVRDLIQRWKLNGPNIWALMINCQH